MARNNPPPAVSSMSGTGLTGPAALQPLMAASTAEPVTPVPDKYAFRQQTNKGTNRRTTPLRKATAFAAGT